MYLWPKIVKKYKNDLKLFFLHYFYDILYILLKKYYVEKILFLFFILVLIIHDGKSYSYQSYIYI